MISKKQTIKSVQNPFLIDVANLPSEPELGEVALGSSGWDEKRQPLSRVVFTRMRFLQVNQTESTIFLITYLNST